MNESKPPSFWTTLPGILAGIASLLTALVAVFGLMEHREKTVPPSEITQSVPSGQTIRPDSDTQALPPAQTAPARQDAKTAPTIGTTPAIQVVQEVQPPPAAVVELKNLDDCGEFVGKWNWFIGGELRAEKDGSVDWRQKPEDAQPVIVGRWVCLNTQPQQVNISWPNGISETLVFSPDWKSLSGRNTIGVQVSGSKKPQL